MLLALSLAYTMAFIQQGHRPDDAASIRALYPKIDRIFETKDWRAASNMIASDYTEDSADHRKINKQTFMKEHIAAFKPMYDIKADVEPLDIQTQGKTATVEVRYTMTAKFKDPKGVHAFKFDGSEVHRWRHERAGWKLGYVKEHDWTVTVDGKVVQHAP